MTSLPLVLRNKDSRNHHTKHTIRSIIMNKLQFKGNWEQVKGRLKSTYGSLTDDDLTYVEGKEQELIGKLTTKLGKSEEEVRKILED